jgi:DNA polymerase I-like protein with 3'-5' exonuclease and polymerase domains
MPSVSFDSQDFEYTWWNGEKLSGTKDCPMALDVETERIPPYRPLKEGEDVNEVPACPLTIPKLSIGMAFDGKKLVLIHPSDMTKFVAKHNSTAWVGHNIQFDWHVISRHCGKATTEDLYKLGDNNLLADSMILDMLLQLGTGKYRKFGAIARAGDKARMYPTTLGVLSEEWKCGELDKTDPYRLRFGELIGLSKQQIDEHPEAANFFAYALKDVIATWRIYKLQRQKALEVMKRAGWNPNLKLGAKYEIRPDAVEKYGVLSEALQVKASIVLAELSRTPLRIDKVKREAAESDARRVYGECLDVMTATDPTLIKRYTSKKRLGEIKLTKQSKLPQINQKALVNILESEAKRLNVSIPKSKGKTKGTSTSAKCWCHLNDRSPFIKAWSELEKVAKLLEFLTALDAEKVYCRYNLLMLNGRTSGGAFKKNNILLVPSCNIQQMPREDHDHPERSVRELFISESGTKWYSCDYGYVELRTLAAFCRAAYGYSKLGDAIEDHYRNGGADPHQRTAAMIAGKTLEEFFRLPEDEQEKLRQSAKAVNFGFPGGLGLAKFVEYAMTSYGVRFTAKSAKDAKKAWLNLYPELKEHLGDRTDQATQWQTGRKLGLVWMAQKRLSDYLRIGNEERKKFSEHEVDGIWEHLEMLAYGTKDEAVIEAADKRELTNGIRNLLCYRACTLTGRVRNNVKYTDGANTVFSGLAADGAKLALWNLMRNGFKLLSFVHDAIDVAVDPKRAAAQTKTIKQIMTQSMESVIGNNVPVAAKGELGDCWSKG